jgi:N-acetylmuramoyl-L-alanine amidase
VRKGIWFLLVAVLASHPVWGRVWLRGIRLETRLQATEIRIQLSKPVHHTLFTLGDPNRLVVDLRGARPGPFRMPAGLGLVRDVRVGQHTHMLRLVFDLRQPVLPQSFYQSGAHPGQLVLVLRPWGAIRPVIRLDRLPVRPHRVVVCLDPGHGGIDSGAIGPNGLMEKVVTLSVGLDTRALLRGIPGLRVVMTRTGDYYVGLRQRREICERAHGSLFVAIHADSYPVRVVDGATVFALSQHGATDAEARWLAHSENSVRTRYGHVYSVDLRNKSPTLRAVLLNLAQSATIHQSLKLGADLIQELSAFQVPLHRGYVAQANFAVLRDPVVPSVLIECGFISNPWQARELADPQFRERIARAIAKGILKYLYQNHRTRTVLVEAREKYPRHYVVRSGDTLDGIAQRYHVAVRRLEILNHLPGSRLFPGQVLAIPADTTTSSG